jgi:phosphoenolpyruvate synthase/pyruvate phosphate dikinase
MYIVDASSKYADLKNMVGGKARNLHILSNNSISVPKWFCLSTKAYTKHIEGIDLDISVLLETIDYESYLQFPTLM